MSLETKIRRGKMRIDDFFEFIAWKIPRRTHALDAGDYVVRPHSCRENLVVIEKIAELDSPEKGDFVTVNGTTGPINANVFIKINKGNFPEYLLIEGDELNEGNCSVYDLVNKYLRNRCKQS